MKIINVVLYVLIIAVVLGLGFYLFNNSKYKNSVTNTNISPTVGQVVTTNPASTNNIKEFVITAKQFAYSPLEIKVKQGDNVRFRITSMDVTHGFAIPEYNINSKLDPNVETIVNFVADKKGTFTFFCNIPCGEGHKDMKGTLIVE